MTCPRSIGEETVGAWSGHALELIASSLQMVVVGIFSDSLLSRVSSGMFAGAAHADDVVDVVDVVGVDSDVIEVVCMGVVALCVACGGGVSGNWFWSDQNAFP